jgi:hypothetical protein
MSIDKNPGGAALRPATVVGSKKIFLTGNAVAGSAGFAAMQNLCANEASAAGLAGTFQPLVSRTNVPASMFLGSLTRYERVDNVFVGTGAEIASGRTRAALWQLANGTYQISLFQWTGSPTPAQVGTASTTCGDWLVSTSTGTIGRTEESDGTSWWNESNASCNASRRIYCVQQ